MNIPKLIKQIKTMPAYLLLLVSLLVALLFTIVFINRFTLPYNEAGRYFDPVYCVVYDVAALEIYIFLSIISIVFFILSLIMWDGS